MNYNLKWQHHWQANVALEQWRKIVFLRLTNLKDESGFRWGYIFAVFIFHLNIFYGFKVLTPEQRGEISFPPRSVWNRKKHVLKRTRIWHMDTDQLQ